MTAAHALASHAAIRRNDQPLRRNVLERMADQVGDFVRPLDLQGMMVDDADDDFLFLDDLADCLEIARPRRACLESDGVGVDAVERFQSRLIALHFLEDALLARIAPAGVAPDLGFVLQALDRGVEDLDQIVDVELAEGLAAHRHHVNLRLLHLNERASNIGQFVKFGVERSAERHGPLDRVLVIVVGDRGGEQLRQDGAEFDRTLGHALRHFPHRGVLQIAAADRPDDLRKHPRFEEVVQDMAARIGDGADIVDRGLRFLAEPCHMRDRIALPAHAADFFVVMRIAVGADVQPGDFLRAQERRHGVLVLLAVARIDHRLEKTLRAERRIVPGRARQRSDDRCRQHHIGCGLEHSHSPQAAAFFCCAVLPYPRLAGKLPCRSITMANDCQFLPRRLGCRQDPGHCGHLGRYLCLEIEIQWAGGLWPPRSFVPARWPAS